MTGGTLSNRPATILPTMAGGAVPFGETAAVPLMPYACKSCSTRKVKCDKFTPRCSNCEKSNLICEYEAPPPRKKRKLRETDSEVLERLNVYEKILAQNGLLPGHDPRENRGGDDALSERSMVKNNGDDAREDVEGMRRLMFVPADARGGGKLLEGANGEVRFVGSRVWETLGEQDKFDEDEVGDDEYQDVMSAAFVDVKQELSASHPCREDALFLWRTHVERVEPICKVSVARRLREYERPG